MAHEPFNLLARYQMLVGALRDSSLTRGDCVVLSVILAHVDADGEAWPGLTRICTQAGISRSTAIRAIDRLESLCYLSTERQIGRSNRYTVMPDVDAFFAQTRVTHDTGSAGAPVSPVTPLPCHGGHHPRVTHDTGPVSPVTPELVLELDPKNSIQRTGVDFDQLDRDHEQQLQAKRVAKEEADAKEWDERCQSLRAEYLATVVTHPEWAKGMEQSFPRELADLLKARAL